MSLFHTQVRLTGFPFEDSQLTVKLSGTPGQADIGKALTQDLSADNTMKLAADGDPIVAVLLTVENRTVEGTYVGTASFRWARTMPIKAGLTGAQAVVRGSRLCGAGGGEVRAIDWTTPTAALAGIYAGAPRVWAVNALVADVTKIA